MMCRKGFVLYHTWNGGLCVSGYLLCTGKYMLQGRSEGLAAFSVCFCNGNWAFLHPLLGLF